MKFKQHLEEQESVVRQLWRKNGIPDKYTDAIVELLRQSNIATLKWVVENCSGGGDWRRKIMQAINEESDETT